VDMQLFRVAIFALNYVALKSESTRTMFARCSALMGLAWLINASSSLIQSFNSATSLTGPSKPDETSGESLVK
jgi:hypothetical protein